MFVLCCLMLWVLSGMAARADPGSVSGAGDPNAAARVIGNAGTAAAGAIARDASNAASVPGYAGTDLPERNTGTNALEDEARARLADPDDPGGDAGRTVIEGKRGLTGPEFVRFAALATMEDRPPAAAEDRLAPLIQMTFRVSYIMATKMRDEMLDTGRAEELDKLVAAARALQDEVLGRASK